MKTQSVLDFVINVVLDKKFNSLECKMHIRRKRIRITNEPWQDGLLYRV